MKRRYDQQWDRPHKHRKRRIIITLIILALFVAGFWYLYRMIEADDTIITNTGGATVGSNIKLLEIPEWGVALRLDDYTADTTYEFINDRPYVALSNSQLTEIARNYQPCNTVNTAVRLVRASPGDNVYGEVLTEAILKNKGIKIGQYYYFIYKAGACDTRFNNAEVIANVDSIQQRLSQLYITTIPFKTDRE